MQGQDRSVSVEEPRHMALPQLVGAPAYARPAPQVIHTPRPFNPDDLPIAAAMTDDEVELAEGRSRIAAPDTTAPAPKPRLFSLRGMADRLRGAGN